MTEFSMIAPHPVSRLLSDEQKARVRAARFERRKARGKRAQITALVGRKRCCPIGVALGTMSFPSACDAAYAVVRNPHEGNRSEDLFYDFMELIDNGKVEPADVYSLLGCSEPLP